MKLDETILQSNTCLELVEFIKEIYCEAEPTFETVDKYNYVMKKVHKALKRRSRGYQVTDMFEGEQLDKLEKEYKEEQIRKKLEGSKTYV